jgi:preprotein translocase subunit SecF
MFIIKNKAIFLTLSAIIVLGSLLAVAVYGLKLGIDFKGGTLLELSYTTGRPKPIWPAPSPTIIRAEKLNLRPPFTTLEDRLM